MVLLFIVSVVVCLHSLREICVLDIVCLFVCVFVCVCVVGRWWVVYIIAFKLQYHHDVLLLLFFMSSLFPEESKSKIIIQNFIPCLCFEATIKMHVVWLVVFFFTILHNNFVHVSCSYRIYSKGDSTWLRFPLFWLATHPSSLSSTQTVSTNYNRTFYKRDSFSMICSSVIKLRMMR